MIQKHNFSNAALLNGLTMRKETHQTADDKWRHELGQAEAEVAKLAVGFFARSMFYFCLLRRF